MTAAKISYVYVPGVEPAFSTASELRDALLASYPAAAALGAPVVVVGRDETAPAWGWVKQLLRTRTDWWPVLGVALQHAAQDGGDLARIALADLLETYQESVVLLEWTEPVAARWPDVRATTGASGIGRPDYRLATIVAGQRALWNTQQSAEVAIEGIGPGGEYLVADVKTAAELEPVLAASAAAGRAAEPGEGPWSWLVSELLFHHWMQPVIPAACAKLAAGTDAEVRAVLDWFADEHDLWRYVELLEGWRGAPPPWWNEPVGRKLRARGAKTLGEVALGALDRARGQAATPPIVDL